MNLHFEPQAAPRIRNHFFKPIALLVEKDENKRTLYKRLIARTGHLVVEAETIEKAKKIIEEIDVDVVYFDRAYPGWRKVRNELENLLADTLRYTPVVQINNVAGFRAKGFEKSPSRARVAAVY